MAQYHLDVSGRVKLSDYSSIHDYMELINKNDKFTISIEKGDKENIDIICNMLKTSKFSIIDTSGKENGKCSIEAFKSM